MLETLTARLIIGFVRLLTGAQAFWRGGRPNAAQRIFFANHASHGDFVLLWASLPPWLRRHTRPVAGADYWNKNALRQYIGGRVFRAVLIDRERKEGSPDPIGQMVASAPPASMMSASSSLIIRAASPIECAPVEHAVTTEWLGPIRPYLIETWPLVRLISRPWPKCGETRPGPFSARTSDSFSIPGRPPMPEPIEQPKRNRTSSLASTSPASSIA
jgi:hypothetical protein